MSNTITFRRPMAWVTLLFLLLSNTITADNSQGQSTEGTDFWVTFLQADQDPNNELQLSLSISSRTDCEVTISNPFTGYSEKVTVAAGGLRLIELYKGNVLTYNARNSMSETGKVCYSVHSEKVDTCALHVTATAPIALFATNYKRATFDATNVIPSTSLQDSYMIQTYTPSDHGGVSATQGSHFAIIATEDNTIVDYCPTEETTSIREFRSEYAGWGDELFNTKPEYLPFKDFTLGDTLSTPVLMKGQVYYVWTGKADGEVGDLSGTTVKARDGKKIAVFQGCPHTNIPYQKKQRDHIFSQAMPTQYWGNTFALTASASRKRDIIRVMSLYDGTEVRINGELKHTFDFENGDTNDKKHFFEFEIGEEYGSLAAPLVNGKSCLVETSCPCAVHLFMVSQQYDGDKNNNGDPAMLWINPIEQQIDQVTFATYASSNGTTNHYTNIVTDKPELMMLDGVSIASDFLPVTGSSTYYFAQKSLGTTAATHTLKSNGSNFIAHVYGFTSNESYGYSAGGATKALTQAITINGKIFTPDTENTLCGKDTIIFKCDLNYEYESIKWHFGDGTPDVTGLDSVAHLYKEQGQYKAYVLIERLSTNLCAGQLAVDSIPITVDITRYTFDFDFRIDGVDVPCKIEGEPFEGKILYTNESEIKLTELSADECTLSFDDAAQNAGFTPDRLTLTDDYIAVKIPDDAKNSIPYGIIIRLDFEVHQECLDTAITYVDTVYFQLNYDSDILTQRFDNVLGLRNDTSFIGDILSDFQWYRTSDSTAIANQQSAVLNRNDFDWQEGDEYYLCFTLNKGTDKQLTTCTCAKPFKDNSDTYNFDDSITISTYTAKVGQRIYINAEGVSEYYWYNTSGQLIVSGTLPDKGGSVAIPTAKGLYILRVTTGKSERNFKFSVTD